MSLKVHICAKSYKDYFCFLFMKKKHFTASVFIVFDNKILLHEHKKSGLILQPGGHIEENESPSEAALREVKEETGLDVKLYSSKKLKDFDCSIELNYGEHMNMHLAGDHYHMDFVFYGRALNNLITSLEENNSWKWYSKDEVEVCSKIPNNVKFYAIDALMKLKN